jgi:cytidylate kinase
MPTDGPIDVMLQKQLEQYRLFREQLAESRELAGPRHAPVITVSRMTGCCARDLSELLAARLGLQVWSPDLIDLVAKDDRLREEVVDLLAPEVRERIAEDIEAMIARQRCRDDAPTRALVQVVRILAETGGVVIHGRGGAFILRDRADLRLRLVSTEQRRLEEVMRRRGLDAQQAGVFMRAGDSRRTAFVRLLFHADLNDPKAYDLVLNTEHLEPEGAADLAVQFLELRRGG